MTEAEAIKWINDRMCYGRYIPQKHNPFIHDECCQAGELAINALKKQVPKKIIYRRQNYGTPYLCCECEADQTPTEFFCEDGSEPKEKHTFCWKCGQKLDWSEV